MKDLAERISSFMYGHDTYGFKDCYETLEDFTREILMSLYDKVKRNVIALELKEIVEWSEIDVEAYEASMLYREVKAI